MSKKRFNLIIRFTGLALCIPMLLSGQLKDIGTFTQGGVDDAQKLLKGYLTPWANALGTSLSGGWYNTAKVHKLGGFDITLTMNMGFVPAADKTFSLDELDLTGTPSANEAPTAAGKMKKGPEIRYDALGVGYNTPKGTGLGFVPSPMVQASVGLIKGTEISGRYMPGVELGKFGSFGLWGVGLKHSLLQWLPFVDRVPALHVAVQGGFTKLNYGKSLSFTPDKAGIAQGNDQTSSDITFDGQELDMTFTSITANLLVGANLPVVSFYAGVGIANTNADMTLRGYYPIATIDGNGHLVLTDESVGKSDPISYSIENKSGSPTQPRYNVGMRLKFGPITLHGDYTKAYYSNVTVGLGVSIR